MTYEPSGDRVVILDADGEFMTTLNPVGSVIWNALDDRDAPTLAEGLAETFDGIGVDELLTDIEEFVTELVAMKLVEID